MSRGTKFIVDPEGFFGPSRPQPIGGIRSHHALFPEGTEFRVAIEKAAEGPRSFAVPDETIIHIYAYEAIERVRILSSAGAADDDCPYLLPIWPPAMFLAAGIRSHSFAAMSSVLPQPIEVSIVERPTEAIAAAARECLGRLPFLPGRYIECLAECGARIDDSGRRRTSAGLLWRDGKILLEERPPTKSLTPDVWDIPGGHIEANESPREALVREMREELGVEVLLFELAVLQDTIEPPRALPYRHFTHLVESWRGEPRGAEGQTVEWFAIDAALSLRKLNRYAREAILEIAEIVDRRGRRLT